MVTPVKWMVTIVSVLAVAGIVYSVARLSSLNLNETEKSSGHGYQPSQPGNDLLWIQPEAVGGRGNEFESALDNRDFEGMQSLLADAVTLYIDGSECCGTVTPEIVIENLRIQIGTHPGGDFAFEGDVVAKVARTFEFGHVDPPQLPRYGVMGNAELVVYSTNSAGSVDFILLSPLEPWL